MAGKRANEHIQNIKVFSLVSPTVKGQDHHRFSLAISLTNIKLTLHEAPLISSTLIAYFSSRKLHK